MNYISIFSRHKWQERASRAFELNSNDAPSALNHTSGFTYYLLLNDELL
ncbi:hypothetical protein H1P_180010 [Hyella patelloides LEGE 07179]|uniref:Uncharacterized protein n=1 Tax=Hyella patelloides LEGE 07179 TaxID=945734 RepID=A0A563VNM4_9CYAN|nr:hypothetical protein H1P_180010 [Hyella patelloides LEGE 07179]